GAPVAPWTMRQTTSVSRDWDRPHKNVAIEKLKIPRVITRLLPKRATSHPVIGVTTAVARMLKVIAQAISSCVADMAPCICGRRVEAGRSAVEYRERPSNNIARII